MTSDAADVVASGSLPLAVMLAVAAGTVSFASPCVLPLVPGFLGYVTGLTDHTRRTRVVAGAALFVIGFSVVFVSLSVALNAAMSLFFGHRDLLMRGGGVLVILLALVYLGFIGQRGLPVRWRPAAGLLGAPVLGMVFGIGMSPCIGPVYGAIQVAASPLSNDGAPVLRGVLLAAGYSLGLGLPFVLIAAGWARADRASRWLRTHHRATQRLGGVLMLAVGVLMVTGAWQSAMTWIQVNLSSGFTPAL
ncbi:cytochrome C biogenesis protein CcdA [Dermacoccus nishinomiyaensis]|uniref:cytochrome c biogenesis CcdA family protein n=1 Tax=Dermacoccus TaxID=57495 RepID=UPI0001E6423E|nr:MULTISPECIES: cytochrome c biogenesis protein CcdA [Dermacoccus]EFP58530.1 cytochrome C biogenesis protein transmembrane region [Dermacoccus sp. Ellin185]MBO1758987.1 cytochrome C biogenesis protein CcdA [Dermacoccus sp. NHGro5]TCJ90313.1 cytochrome c-type biogenesis protein [Dermacoccus sp. SAI-028]TJZ98183.1 cytochrome C biogenesis protein CcdA [Dermacoccus nishinomiyaensis]